MGGMFGAIGVLAALRERERTGRGQEVQSALFENCVFLSSQHMQQYLMTGEAPPPMPSRVSAWSVYDVFTLAGGEQLFIGAVSDKQFATLCRVLDRADLLQRPEYADNAARVAVRPNCWPSWAPSWPAMNRPGLRRSWRPQAFPTRPSRGPSNWWTTRTCAKAAAWLPCRPKTAARPTWCCCPCS